VDRAGAGGVGVLDFSSERAALLAQLAARGWAVPDRPAPAALCDALVAAAGQATWSPRSGEGFHLDTAPLTAAGLRAQLGEADLLFVRHAAGQYGLPPLEGEGVGVILDLNSAWPSQHGGLLLFDQTDHLEGRRPEPGALTLFDTARPPLLTLVTPNAAPRLALYGRLDRV
jgi:hypothetical protein